MSIGSCIRVLAESNATYSHFGIRAFWPAQKSAVAKNEAGGANYGLRNSSKKMDSMNMHLGWTAAPGRMTSVYHNYGLQIHRFCVGEGTTLSFDTQSQLNSVKQLELLVADGYLIV